MSFENKAIDRLLDLYRGNLDAFMDRAFRVLEPGTPFEWNWHGGCLAEHLQANFSGELPRLIVNMPPRCLKSVSVARAFPAWALGKEQSHQFIGTSYSHGPAERNVIGCRNIIRSEWYKTVFPDLEISSNQDQKHYFTTTKNGQYLGASVEGTITSYGCKTLIIDDPINPQDGASDLRRMRAIEGIRGTLFSRFNDRRDARIVLIMQRLHDADPTGDLLKDGGYELLKLPAEASKQIHINLSGKSWRMDSGDLLTPRLPRQELDKLKIELGSYNYAGQYLQEPVPVGGGEFKTDWPQFYKRGSIKPQEMNIYILCDPAGGEELQRKKKKLSDYTAYFVIGLAPDNNRYVLDIVRSRMMNPKNRIDEVFRLHRKWNELSGKPPKIGYERYGLMTDNFYIRERQSEESYRFPLIELGGGMEKNERIRRMIADFENGRWYFPQSLEVLDENGRMVDLIHELIHSEMATFPKSRYDDMLDAMSRIYDPEMQAIFPRLKTKETMTARAMREAYYAQDEQGWLDA